MSPDEVTIVMLAAGYARRYGDNKLTAPLGGVPLAEFAAKAARSAGTHRMLAVVPSGDTGLSRIYTAQGFSIIENDHPEDGQGASLARGIEAVQTNGALVMLADMPLVPRAHLAALIDRIGEARVAISTCDGQRMPPALFCRDVFPDLSGLHGEEGARGVLAKLDHIIEIPLPDRAAIDIDTPSDLEALARVMPQ